jgi:hypothetical protein
VHRGHGLIHLCVFGQIQNQLPKHFTSDKIDYITVDFNLLFTQMFRTSFRIRCQVQKFIMKFTNRFVNKASDWLLNQTSQSNAQFTNLFVNFIMNFWTWQQICEVRNEVLNIWVKSKLKSTVIKQKDVHGTVDNKLINPSSCIASQCALLYYFTLPIARLFYLTRGECWLTLIGLKWYIITFISGH